MLTRQQYKDLSEIIDDPILLLKVVHVMSEPAPQTVRNRRYLAKHHGGKDPRCRTAGIHTDSTQNVPKNVPKNVPNGTIGYSSISRASLEKKEISGCARDAQIDEWFEDLWPEYPKRQGQNPKKPAKAKFRILVRKGGEELALAIAGGVGRLAAALERDGVEPRYFPQMITWLNQERWNDGIDEGSEPQKQGAINGHSHPH